MEPASSATDPPFGPDFTAGCSAVIEGTVIRLQVEHLHSGATPKPVWLRWSGTDAGETEVDMLWQAFLRRFDIEHTFRLFKLHPAPARPSTGGRPPAAVGEAVPAPQAHPSTSPP